MIFELARGRKFSGVRSHNRGRRPFSSPEPPFLLVTWLEKRHFKTSSTGDENGTALGGAPGNQRTAKCVLFHVKNKVCLWWTMKTKECLCLGTSGLIVALWKFDVLKTSIFVLEASLLGQTFFLRTSNFWGGNYQPIVPRQKHSIV